MKREQSTTCCAGRRTHGLTLIEVVAAIAILGTLLVGVVLAKSRHTRQLQLARAQTYAIEATDALITDWWTSADGPPIGQRGAVPGEEGLVWRTRLVDNRPIQSLGARVLRVEVFDTSQAQQASGFGPNDTAALVVVDLVVPDPEVESREAEEQRDQDEEGRLSEGGQRA